MAAYVHGEGHRQPSLLLEDGPAYWFLFRYFEAANMDPSSEELMPLYGGRILSSYEVERLEYELREARLDALARPGPRRVLVGWSEMVKSKSSERWQEIASTELIETIDQLLEICAHCRQVNVRLVCSGD